MASHVASDERPREGVDAGAFLNALDARRTSVLREVRGFAGSRQLGELVFDLLTYLALNPQTTVDGELISSFSDRYELPDGALEIRLASGHGAPLLDVLRGAIASREVIDAVNALFTTGYDSKLTALDVVERRNFTVRVVGMLPGVERVGPFLITDFLDAVCAEDDALRFWQIYVDRVAVEINKRAPADPLGPHEPWLLTALLKIHREGPGTPRDQAWVSLTRYVNRVLQAHRHRWRFIRSLAEGCQDVQMLNYLCTAPAMTEDPELLPLFLTRGNGKLVSCAVYALYLFPESEGAVDDALERLRERPLAETASRLLELYGQAHVPEHPGPALRKLARGIIDLVAEGIQQSPPDVPANAVARDARALRQGLLLVDAQEAIAATDPARAARMLERVLFTFFQSFTPTGVDHPLNDSMWRHAVQRALVSLINGGAADARERLEAFGLGIGQLVHKWVEGDDARAEAYRARLASRFLTVFADTLLGVCRELHADEARREAAIACYATLVRVFRANDRIAYGSGRFGAIEYVVPSLFPDLAPGVQGPSGPDGDPPAERVYEAAAMVARIEAGLWPQTNDRTLRLAPAGRTGLATTGGPLARVAEGALQPAGEPGAPPLLRTRPTRETPLRAPAALVSRGGGVLSNIIRTYLGADVIRMVGHGIGRVFGIRRGGELRITDRELVMYAETRMGNQILTQKSLSHPLDELTAVRTVQQLRAFYHAVGLTGLVAGGVTGGHLIFVGLRAAEMSLAAVGGGILLAGFLMDAAMSHVAERNRRSVALELRFRGKPSRLRVLLDEHRGAAILDAFMTADAERREAEQLDEWAALERDDDWYALEFEEDRDLDAGMDDDLSRRDDPAVDEAEDALEQHAG
jgi:hypothetical protein